MHLVCFRTSEGKPGYHHAEELDEAVHFLERLRNTEDVSEVRLYKLTEIPVAFKAYFRAEVASSGKAPVDSLQDQSASIGHSAVSHPGLQPANLVQPKAVGT